MTLYIHGMSQYTYVLSSTIGTAAAANGVRR